MKKCACCKVVKDLSEFGVRRSHKSGLNYYCKQCVVMKSRSESYLRKTHKEYVSTRTEKRCSRCLVVKDINEFYLKSNKSTLDKRDSRCKFCTAFDAKKQDNKRTIRNMKKKLDLMYLVGGECASCGLIPSESWPVACFDFHHLDRDKKEHKIANLLKSKNDGFQQLLTEEVKKCVLLCANCHRKAHARTLQH